MLIKLLAMATLIEGAAIVCAAQSPPPTPNADTAPIYNVTVVSRSLSAISYMHRGDPTKIDFKGTVLLPAARGEATVESKKGRIEIESKFEHLGDPQSFGPSI